jgi:GTPase
MQGVVDAHAVWNGRVSTNPLNRWLSDVISRIRRPRSPAAALKLNYITQAKARPPSFVLFCSRADAMPESYLRYLVNGLREAFDLPGTPIRVTLREKDNPFAHKKKKQR